MIKYISIDEYKALWEKCKSSMRFPHANLDPILKQMTVQGLSGTGTDFYNEYDRLMFKNNNPDIPREIQYYEKEGLVVYRPKNE